MPQPWIGGKTKKKKKYMFTKISKFSRYKFDNITPKIAYYT